MIRRAAALTAALGAAAAIACAAPASAAANSNSRANLEFARSSHHAPMRIRAWRWAMKQHYKPYEWGGTGPAGFDCSGLVYRSYLSRGVYIGRDTYDMLASSRLVRTSHPRRGDLAFYGSGHVELYDKRHWTYGALRAGTKIGFHRTSAYWHPTAYYRVRR